MIGVVKTTLADPVACANLVESLVVAHLRRHRPPLYLKSNRGEADLAWQTDAGLRLVEVKWRTQLRAKEATVLARAAQARLLARVQHAGEVHGIPTVPLPLALATDLLRDL